MVQHLAAAVALSLEIRRNFAAAGVKIPPALARRRKLRNESVMCSQAKVRYYFKIRIRRIKSLLLIEQQCNHIYRCESNVMVLVRVHSSKPPPKRP